MKSGQFQHTAEDINRIGTDRIERAVRQIKDTRDPEHQCGAHRQHGVDRASYSAVNQDFKHAAPMQ